MQHHPHSILVVNASHFGRALLMLPAMQALRERFPHTFILAAAAKGISELLKDFQLADETVDLGIIKPTDKSYSGAIKRFLRLMRTTNREGFDFVLDFSPKLETQIAAKLGWRARHVTPSRFANVLDVLLKRQTIFSDNHAADCAFALKKIGVRSVAERYAFPLIDTDGHRFEDLLRRSGSQGAEPVVVLYSSQVGGAHSWPLEKFSETAFRLANNFHARIVAVDEPYTNDFTKAMKASLPKGAILIAAPRSGDFLAAFARASLVITDERGVAKTAADLDAPVIEITDSPSPVVEANSYQVFRSSSPQRVSTEEVYETACAMIQEGRTLPLFRR
jgi:ADP-heptose:LPS heptosyltransferase